MTNQNETPVRNKSTTSVDSVPPPLAGHSPFGVVSIIIGILNPTLFLIFGYFGYRGTPYTLIRILESSVLCVVPFLWIAGLVLAIIALTRKQQRKLLPVVGLILNLMYLCPLVFSYYAFFISG